MRNGDNEPKTEIEYLLNKIEALEAENARLKSELESALNIADRNIDRLNDLTDRYLKLQTLDENVKRRIADYKNSILPPLLQIELLESLYND